MSLFKNLPPDTNNSTTTKKDISIFVVLVGAGIFTHVFSLYVFFIPITAPILFLLTLYYSVKALREKIRREALFNIGKFLFFSYTLVGIWGYFVTTSKYASETNNEQYLLILLFIVLLGAIWFIVRNFQLVFFFKKYTNPAQTHFLKTTWIVPALLTCTVGVFIFILSHTTLSTMNTQDLSQNQETSLQDKTTAAGFLKYYTEQLSDFSNKSKSDISKILGLEFKDTLNSTLYYTVLESRDTPTPVTSTDSNIESGIKSAELRISNTDYTNKLLILLVSPEITVSQKDVLSLYTLTPSSVEPYNNPEDTSNRVASIITVKTAWGKIIFRFDTKNTLTEIIYDSIKETLEKEYKTISAQFDGVAQVSTFSYPILNDWNVSEVTKTNNEYHFVYTSKKEPQNTISIKVVHTNEYGPLMSAAVYSNKNNVMYRYLYDPRLPDPKAYPNVTNFLNFGLGEKKGSVRIYFNAKINTEIDASPLIEIYLPIIDSLKVE